MKTEINRELGSNWIPTSEKVLNDEDCEYLTSKLQVKTNSGKVDIYTVAIVLQGSFASEKKLINQYEKKKKKNYILNLLSCCCRAT